MSHAWTSVVDASCVPHPSHPSPVLLRVLQEQIWCSPRLWWLPLLLCLALSTGPALPFCRHVCVSALKPWRHVGCLPSASVLTSPPLAPPSSKLLVLQHPLQQRVPSPRLARLTRAAASIQFARLVPGASEPVWPVAGTGEQATTLKCSLAASQKHDPSVLLLGAYPELETCPSKHST